MQLTTSLIIASAALASATASLHDVNSPHLARLQRRQSNQDAASVAKETDPKQECEAAYQNPLEGLKGKKLPEPQKIAEIIDGDDEAKKVWQEIQDSGIIPKDVKQKKDTTSDQQTSNMGTSAQASNYDVQGDPDCWWTANRCTEPKHDKIPKDISSCPEPSTWGLTFDDGPYCSHNEFYDFLKKKKLKATLFYIGTQMYNFPLQAQRGLADGHDICVHTWAHRYMTTLSDEQVFAELFYTARAIKILMGVTPSCWRPPFGDTDDRVRAIAAGLGLRTILWEEDTDDWQIDEGKSEDDIRNNYQNIIGKADSESPIVLSHELSTKTMKMFEEMEPKISDAYKHIVPITACQNVTKPYAEDITYPDFADFIKGNIEPKGVPDIGDIKANPDANYKVVKLSDMKNGYANPGQGSSGGSKDGSGNGSDGGSKDSGKDGKGENGSSSLLDAKIGVISVLVAMVIGTAVVAL